MAARVACIGECMVELRERADGTLARSHGGDTLNTAVYLARLGVPVDYVTALGDDAWSGEMLASWEAEGVGTTLVRRMAGRLPGLYIIQTDASGERRFLYWRDSAPARELFSLPGAAALHGALAGYGLLYVSGITLSILGPSGCAALFAALDAARAQGGRVAFNTNYRPRGWPDRDGAAALFRQALARSDLVFASVEDLEQLFGADGIRLLEVTLRTPAGLEGAAAIIAAVPEATVGIGTVLTPADLHRSIAAGARFALSPGATPSLLDAAAEASIPFLPGVATASELMAAMERGFTAAKFFPATAAGGIPALRALAGPFPHARFCPTGGITEDNAADWLALPNVVALGGTWLTPANDIAAGRWDDITKRAARIVERVGRSGQQGQPLA